MKRAALPTKLPASDTTSTYSATGTAPVNGKAVASAISGKANKAEVPTKTEMNSAIAAAVGGISGISFSIVSSLPGTGRTGVIYLVAHAHGAGDSYDEYIWLEESKTFEKIGNTDVDLSGYVKKSELVPISNEEIDAMFT